MPANDLSPNILPDVPDAGQSPPDACRTDAGPSQFPPDSTLPASDESLPALVVKGELVVRGMHRPRESAKRLIDTDVRALLQTPSPPDTVIEAIDGTEFSVLDADVHHWPTPPTDDELEAYAAAVHPQPDAIWVSHGKGLKLLFVGPHHRPRAVAAALSVPRSFTLELLTHTRHPASASTKHGSAACGPVRFPATDPQAEFTFAAVGRPSPEVRQQALAELGLEDGGRYDHDRCPIEPHADSDSKGCVTVLDTGVYCFRCAARDLCYGVCPRPGFVTFAALVGTPTTDMDYLVANRVHWTHAQIVLRHQYPHLGPALLQEAYHLALQASLGNADPRVGMIFNDDLDFVWGCGTWLDAATYRPTDVDNDAVAALPHALNVVRGKDGNLTLAVDLARRSKVKNRRPRGHVPIRPVRGITFLRDEDTIPVLVQPAPTHPITLVGDPMPEEEIKRRLTAAFPRLDYRYLTACLAAAICAEVAGGQPPMLACTGPSGSAKEQTIRLAASFVGEDTVKLFLADEEEPFARQIGVALTAGHRFLVFDEFGKTPGLSSKLKNIFAISTVTTWRPLCQNRLVTTRTRAAFFFPCVRFPDFLAKGQEFNRRARHLHLYQRVPNWFETSGGDTVAWRDRTEENAFVANSFLTHVWRLCNDHGFRFL